MRFVGLSRKFEVCCDVIVVTCCTFTLLCPQSSRLHFTMLSQTTLTFCIAGVTILGGFLAALVAVNFMDLCSKPGERRRQIEVAATAGRRQIELAATRNMCTDVRIETLEKLFPTNKVRT